MLKDLLYHTLQTYAQTISAKESPWLIRLREETEKLPGGQMISSPLQGRVLALFAHLLQPQKILEIGTYTGYSTLCMAEGLSKGGVLYTIEKNKEMVAIAKRYAKATGKSANIEFFVGHALDLLPQFTGPFDLVFIDADKKNYSQYYDLVIPQVRPSGLVIADNIFWKGKVLNQQHIDQDPRTKTLLGFTKKLQEDKQVEIVSLPVRDGLLVARKL